MEAALPADTPSLVGNTLCHQYFLRELKGKGGVADVYLAWDKIRSVKMAIKVLRPEVQHNSIEYQMFEKEAEILRRIEHPFIVRLYELGHHEQIIFLVMDWIEGTDLRKAIGKQKKPFLTGEALRVITPVCRALNFMHQNQVFHCDIKPANILLHVDGRVLVTDFGVARLASERHGGGTPSYMAPEHIMGKKIDARSDVYSLGVTLYEMLSGGTVPFRGDNQSSQGSTLYDRIQWEHCYLEPPSLSLFNPALSPEIIQVVHKSLQKDPQQRFPSAISLLESFEQSLGSAAEQNTGPDEMKARLQRAEPPIPTPALTPIVKKPVVAVNPAGLKGPYLIGQAGQYAGHAIPIPMERLTLGRKLDSGLWFRDRTVSRLHATLTRTRRAVYIQDEDSSLGTFVNNQRVVGLYTLRNGDIVGIGQDQVFEFREK